MSRRAIKIGTGGGGRHNCPLMWPTPKRQDRDASKEAPAATSTGSAAAHPPTSAAWSVVNPQGLVWLSCPGSLLCSSPCTLALSPTNRASNREGGPAAGWAAMAIGLLLRAAVAGASQKQRSHGQDAQQDSNSPVPPHGHVAPVSSAPPESPGSCAWTAHRTSTSACSSKNKSRGSAPP